MYSLPNQSFFQTIFELETQCRMPNPYQYLLCLPTQNLIQRMKLHLYIQLNCPWFCSTLQSKTQQCHSGYRKIQQLLVVTSLVQFFWLQAPTNRWAMKHYCLITNEYTDS